MTDNNYKELVDFMGKQLEKIHSEIVQTKNELKNDIEEAKRHTDILFEDVQHKFEITAEGMAAINEKLDRFHDDNEREHARLDKAALIGTSEISKLDQRVGILEGKI